MAVQIRVTDKARAPELERGGVREIRPDIAYMRTLMVNVVFVGTPDARDRCWVLIDAGLSGSADAILDAAAERFGPGSRPLAIVLTHGHFDHVGAVEALSKRWEAPVHAHPLEHPYLKGQLSYPPADTRADGGLIAKLASFFPRKPIDISDRLLPLPRDGSIPGLQDFWWVHTPGHTPGHVSLWRPSDRVLIAGDAIITTGQESAYEVAVQALEMHGPPRYFTPDWLAAGDSVEALAKLNPDLLISGHGRALAGPEMQQALRHLAADFHSIAPPGHLRKAKSAT